MDSRGYAHTLVPVWPVIGLWQVCVVLAVRWAWDERSALQRIDGHRGHVFYAGREELWAGVLAGVMSLPLMAFWRFERTLWEASILFGPAGRNSFAEVSTGAQWAMLVQIVLIHWLLVWMVYRWMLRRGLRRGTVTVRAGDRCPTCGYETAGGRCSECGADRNDARSVRPRVWIPWIENRAWARWVFRTPTALGAIVFLFFSPVWVPAIRMGVRAMFP